MHPPIMLPVFLLAYRLVREYQSRQWSRIDDMVIPSQTFNVYSKIRHHLIYRVTQHPSYNQDRPKLCGKQHLPKPSVSPQYPK